MARGLNVRERRFVDAYLGSCGGNGTRAVLAAGITSNRKSAGVIAVRLLANVRVRAAIEKRSARATEDSIATADERDKKLTRILRHPQPDDSTRIAAIRELNKCSGRHSIKHVLDVTEKLSDIIAGSRSSE